MEKFNSHTGTVAILHRDNIDTDQIIPKDFLKSIRRTGFGQHLFQDWRYLPDGSNNPQFELNRPEARGASVLLTGNNFGCGSSREHAVWALMQYGFRAVIASCRERDGARVPAFADIFRSNALRNGLLTVELALSAMEELQAAVERDAKTAIRIDLAAQTVALAGKKFPFPIAPAAKEKLLLGLDDIELTLAEVALIAAYERRTAGSRFQPA